MHLKPVLSLVCEVSNLFWHFLIIYLIKWAMRNKVETIICSMPLKYCLSKLIYIIHKVFHNVYIYNFLPKTMKTKTSQPSRPLYLAKGNIATAVRKPLSSLAWFMRLNYWMKQRSTKRCRLPSGTERYFLLWALLEKQAFMKNRNRQLKSKFDIGKRFQRCL